MPIPKNWLEELAAEWLQLDGYLVESNVPILSNRVGGRQEADIIGARCTSDQLEIVHCETGQLAEGQRSVESLRKKFSDEVCQEVQKRFVRMFCFPTQGNVTYRKVYVASYWSDLTMTGANELSIEVKTLPDFIRKDVIPTIQRWKENPVGYGRARGGGITLPEGHWLLCLIDYLNGHKLLK